MYIQRYYLLFIFKVEGILKRHLHCIESSFITQQIFIISDALARNGLLI